MQIPRSTSWWVVVALAALIAVGCSSDAAEQISAAEPSEPPAAAVATPVEAATPIAAPVTEVVATPVAATVAASDGTKPRSDALINWSDDGVTVFEVDGTTRTVTTTPTGFAVLFDSGSAVYQTSPYAIALGSEDALIGIDADPGRTLRLLAGAYVNGEPMVLVSSRVEMPVGPDDAEDRLLLFDARTGGRRDLGVIGGWESSVSLAQFGNDSIVLMRAVAAQVELLFLDLNGDVVERIPLQTEGDYSLAVQSGGEQATLLRPYYDQATGQPNLLIWTAALGQGAILEPRDQALTLDGVELDGSFCRLAAYTNDQTILCNSSTGPPIEIHPQDSYRATAIDGMTSGAVSPAIRLDQDIQTSTTLPELVPVLREIGATADGRFRYFVNEVPYLPGPILVDDGSGLRPAMNDPRSKFRLSFGGFLRSDLTFVDERTVTWRSASTSTGWPTYIGRIDNDGMIIDVAGYFSDLDDGMNLYEVQAVMSSGRDLEIDDGQQLLPLMPEPGRPAGPPGGLYPGVTLSTAPACGGQTLYRSTYDGFGRVLDAADEIAPVIAAFETETHDGPNYESAWIERHLALATSCPDEHEGIRLQLATEIIDYGDNGPRSVPAMWLWAPDGIRLPDGTREFARLLGVTMIGIDCSNQAVVVVDLVGMNGEPQRLRIQRAAGEQPLDVEPVAPQTPLQPSTTKSLCPD